MFVDFFIRRPVFATVCALLIILAGAVVIPTLPISLYPQLAPPQVRLPPATSAPTRRWSSRPSRFHWRSHQRRRGHALHDFQQRQRRQQPITITFQTGYDLNIAAVDVQNRVASAQGQFRRRSTTAVSASRRQTAISYSPPASIRTTGNTPISSSATTSMSTSRTRSNAFRVSETFKFSACANMPCVCGSIR